MHCMFPMLSKDAKLCSAVADCLRNHACFKYLISTPHITMRFVHRSMNNLLGYQKRRIVTWIYQPKAGIIHGHSKRKWLGRSRELPLNAVGDAHSNSGVDEVGEVGEGRRGCGWHAGSATASQALHEHDLADGRRRRQHLPHREPRLRVRALVFPTTTFQF